jgi:hypothetical protein
MITMSTFGSNGRLGNQLFQYAALHGLAKKYQTFFTVPPWQYSEYFEIPSPTERLPDNARLVQEPAFNFVANWPQIKEQEHCDLKGYFQSPLYWKDAKEEVKKALTFKKDFRRRIQDQFVSRCNGKNPFEKKTLAISIRRGDYVGHPSYSQLPVTYYILAMFERFPDWRERSLIIFSDDIPWCRVQFGCLPNAYFSENNNEIEDLCLMSRCEGFIISNSTFSYWGAMLAQFKGPVKVVRPNHHFEGKLKEQNDTRDYYPPNWEVFDHLDEHGHLKKINLTDCSFQIPVFYDHEDRNENLGLCVKHLQKYFNTEVRVMENKKPDEEAPTPFTTLRDNEQVEYEPYYSNVFWRTQMLNRMAKATEKPIIFNWDADCLIAPLQVWCAVEKMRKGADGCFPYDGRFARIPRKTWFVKLRDYGDIGIVGDTQFSGMEPTAAVSVGGTIGWRKEAFIRMGGENEKMQQYAPEDCERVYRGEKLGLKIERVPGAMYHINHFLTEKSTTANPYYGAAKQEFAYIQSLSKEQLEEEISKWNYV